MQNMGGKLTGGQTWLWDPLCRATFLGQKQLQESIRSHSVCCQTDNFRTDTEYSAKSTSRALASGGGGLASKWWHLVSANMRIIKNSSVPLKIGSRLSRLLLQAQNVLFENVHWPPATPCCIRNNNKFEIHRHCHTNATHWKWIWRGRKT